MFNPSSRFLIVDDSSVTRNIVRMALQQMKMKTIDEASNGVAGLDKILSASEQGTPYDLVITDINMPEMDGLKLLELVRAEPKTSNIPVLIVTTDGGKPTVIKAVMSGVSGYMVKPFGVEDVKNKILEIYKRKSEMGDSTSPS